MLKKQIKQPDIVHIFVDQWNARYLGCAGHPQVQTPNLDRLAGEGIRFENAYSPSPVCMAARVSLASGLHPHNHGFFFNYTDKLFPQELITLYKKVRDAGYETAKIGKYHFHSPKWGEDFEDYKDYYDSMGLDFAKETSTPYQGPCFNSEYTRWLKEHNYLDCFIKEIAHGFDKGQYLPQGSKLPPKMTPDGFVFHKTMQYLKDAPTDKPMFLTVSFPGPHTPIDAPGKYMTMYNPDDVVLPENFKSISSSHYKDVAELKQIIALYMGKITHLDDRIGQIIEALKKRGKWDNTVLIFTSDHGDFMGEHGLMSKSRFQDGSVRIPLIIRQGGSAGESGIINTSPVSLIDLYATIIDLAGGIMPDYCQVKSLIPIIHGKCESVNKAVVSEISENYNFNYMVRTDKWKWYIHNSNEALFDMLNDPWEKNNLAQDRKYVNTIVDMKMILLDFLMKNQLNKAAGYKNLFTRMNLQVPGSDREKVLLKKMQEVHDF